MFADGDCGRLHDRQRLQRRRTAQVQIRPALRRDLLQRYAVEIRSGWSDCTNVRAVAVQHYQSGHHDFEAALRLRSRYVSAFSNVSAYLEEMQLTILRRPRPPILGLPLPRPTWVGHPAQCHHRDPTLLDRSQHDNSRLPNRLLHPRLPLQRRSIRQLHHLYRLHALALDL